MALEKTRVTGLLLAGGRSRRLGRDKRLFYLEGESLVQRGFELLKNISEDIWVLVSDKEDERKLSDALKGGAPFLLDLSPGSGPLGALVGALRRIKTPYAFLLSCDYPKMTGEFLIRLKWHLESDARKCKVLVPLFEGIPQVLCAFYHCSLAPVLEEAFGSGERSIKRWLGEFKGEVNFLEEGLWREWTTHEVFFNLNRKEDLERLKGGWFTG